MSRIRDDNTIAEEFIAQVHKGFYFAQERVIDLLKGLSMSRRKQNVISQNPGEIEIKRQRVPC